MPIHHTKLTRAALSGAAIMAAAGLASSAFQEAAAARDRRRFPPPGQLVDIGGRRLHLLEAGQGSPAVVVVGALADGVMSWPRVQRALAAEMRVVLYDRAGVGWSDPPHGHCTLDDMGAELRDLLNAAQITPPYVFVAHSLGGIIARRFAARWPGSVAGMVLVDSSHEQQASRKGVHGWRHGRSSYYQSVLKWQLRPLGLYRLGAAAGLARELTADVAEMALPEHAAAVRAIMLSTRTRRAIVREMLWMAGLTDQPPGLGSIPLTVITATGQDQPGWREMQDELAALSSASRHVLAEGSSHYVHLDDPELVCQAVRELMAQICAGPAPAAAAPG